MTDQISKQKGIGEDWWSVIIGLVLVAAVLAGYLAGAPLDFFKSALPVEWPTKSLGEHFAQQIGAYLLLYAVLAVLTSLAAGNLGVRVGNYLLSFTALFLASVLILVLGSQHTLKYYGLEYPFWALIIGLFTGNLFKVPGWLQSSAGRSELYIKTAIVLLGANLPFTIIIRAGVWGFLEALLIVTAGFAVSFFVGKKLGLDPRFSSVIGAGGSVCGVSAAIAVGNSVKSPQKQVGYVVSLVVLYGLILIFILPVLAKLLHLPDSVAGAWIGGSELADAAGLAAASLVSETAVKSFTLVKLSRDVMIGVLCFVLGTLAVTRWEAGEGGRVSPRVIWERFPKFVLAFLVASALATYGQAQYGQSFSDHVTANLNALRTWLFTMTFFCIGLNTRIQDIRMMGGKPIAVFTIVVLVNVVLGFILANLFFGGILGKTL